MRPERTEPFLNEFRLAAERRPLTPFVWDTEEAR